MSGEAQTAEDEFDQAFTENADASVEQPAEETTPAAPEAKVETSEPSAPAQTVEQRLEAAIRERDEARHRMASAEGRLKTVAQLERERDQLRQQLQAAQGHKQPETQQPAPDVLAEAPDLDAAIKRRIEQALVPVTQRQDEVDRTAKQAASRVEPLVSRQEQQDAERVFSDLDKSFGDWRGTVKSAEFNAWLPQQAEAVQRMFSEGKTFNEAATVLKLYRSDQGAKTEPVKPNTDRLREAAGIPSRAVARPGAKAEDFDGAFAEFALMNT